VWHRKSLSPVVEGFLAVARELLAHHAQTENSMFAHFERRDRRKGHHVVSQG
jgi:hypothetical protein